MVGHVQQSIDRYCELTNTKEKDIPLPQTPCMDDHQIPAEDFQSRGRISEEAAIIGLKALYVVRIGRPDLLWAVNSVAREVTRWTIACDKRLLRLMGYMRFSLNWVQQCYVGDDPADCWLALFSDASFAGDLSDSKSTSGAILCLVGPQTYLDLQKARCNFSL